MTVRSATATKIVVEVDDLTTGLYASKLQLYLSSGIPNGYDVLLNGVVFEPKFIGLSENTGSRAGSILYANV